jgi:hypothetical protein
MKKLLPFAFLFAPVLAFAQTTGTTTTATTTTPVATTTQAMCVSAALEKRENALIAGHDAFAAAVKTALQNRLTGLKDAWSQTDKKVKQEKRQAAYKAFRTESQAAHTAMKTARNNSWKTFETDMRACGVRGHGEMPQMMNYSGTSL